MTAWRRAWAALLALCSALSAVRVFASEPVTTGSRLLPTPPTLELGASIGPTVVLGDAANAEYDPSLRRVGAFAALSVAYRSRYFLDPFFMLERAALASGQAHLPRGEWGDAGTLKQWLDSWLLSPGVTLDLWRIRPRFGLGVLVVEQSNRFLGVESSSSQLAIASQLGLGCNALATQRLRLDAEARLVLAAGADITYVTLGVVARGDLITF